MTRPVWARIDLSALQHNLHRVRQLAPGRAVLAVVKADAYGHGAVAVTAAIADRVEGFAVAGVGEALRLIESGVRTPVHLLSGFHDPDELPVVARHGLVPVVHAPEQLDQLERAGLERPISAWLKFDSGMHRLGFPANEAAAALDRLRRLPQVGEVRAMSHLACADQPGNPHTRRQIEVFRETARDFRCPTSLANSGGIAAWPASHRDWVRPGIMLYGLSPLIGRDEGALDLKPVMSLCSRLIAVHTLRRGETVGYGAAWRCPQDMRVGIAACGYGDGYPRHAPSGTPVRVGGRPAGVAGRVSMDVMAIDLRHAPGARVGDEVELWGPHVSATEVAAAAGTISYELVTGVAQRVPRVVDNGVGLSAAAGRAAV